MSRLKKLAQYEYMLSRPEMFDLGLPFSEEDVDVPFGIYEAPKTTTDSVLSEIAAYAFDLSEQVAEDYFGDVVGTLEDWEDKPVEDHVDAAFDLLLGSTYEFYLDNAFSMIENLTQDKIHESMITSDQLSMMVAAIYTKGFLNQVREGLEKNLQGEFAQRRDRLKEEYTDRHIQTQMGEIKQAIDSIIGGIDAHDLAFQPAIIEYPGNQFPDIAYDIAHKLVNRFDFISWDDIDDQDHWLWEIIIEELKNRIASNDSLVEEQLDR